MDESLVSGKIVLCDELSFGLGALSAGAVGTVMPHEGNTEYSVSFPIAAACLDSDYISNVHEYINTTRYFSSSYFPILLSFLVRLCSMDND